jgi:hypothetical protein
MGRIRRLGGEASLRRNTPPSPSWPSIRTMIGGQFFYGTRPGCIEPGEEAMRKGF